MSTAPSPASRSATSSPLRVIAGAPVAAVDIGGTFTKLGLADASGSFVVHDRMPSSTDPDRAIAQIAEWITAAGESAGVSPHAVGIVSPGHVVGSAGVIARADNLGWRDVAAGPRIAERLGIPAVVEHDVRAAALAESVSGAARGAERAVVAVFGTGVSAGIVLDGAVLEGGGHAGEIGHWSVVRGGPRCVCGGEGHLDGIGSARAIAARYTALTGLAVDGAHEVVARLADDPTARRVWDEALFAIGRTLSAVRATLAPDVIVVGGGLSRAGDALIAPLQRHLDEDAQGQGVPVRVVRAHWGDQVGMIGAAYAARKAAP